MVEFILLVDVTKEETNILRSVTDTMKFLQILMKKHLWSILTLTILCVQLRASSMLLEHLLIVKFTDFVKFTIFKRINGNKLIA